MPLQPQSDGKVERFSRTLRAMLFKFVDENQKDWDLYLLPLMMAYIGPLCTSLLASH